MNETQAFMTKVYGWMSAGLFTTAAVAMLTVSTPQMIHFIVTNSIIFFVLLIAELAAVAYLSLAIKKMSAATATITFLLYAVLNGLTFSILFLVYTSNSIALTFGVTAGMFGIMSVYGYVTKSDLTKAGNFAFMGLIGIILGSLANIFFRNVAFYWVITYIGIVVFVILTASDTQKIKQMNVLGNAGTEEDQKESIMGALTLYLDFINLFLLLLRILGRRRK